MSPVAAPYDWRAEGHRFYSLQSHLRQRFGERVQKVSLDAGFTCPNVDGTVATGGCTYCDNRSFSPSRRQPRIPIREQLELGISKLQIRYDKCRLFLAYFQPATNTYAPVERLRRIYSEAIDHPQVVGMAIGTRPDCVPPDVLDLLEEFGARTYLSLEYGVQSIHDRTADLTNRGHHHDDFLDAMDRSRNRGFSICVHVILGLPGEDREDMLATAREMARVKVDAIKIHNLYVVKNTPMADQWERGQLRLMDRHEYVETLVDFLELLPPSTLVERLSGDAPPDYFLGPTWCLDKPALRKAIFGEFDSRDTWQGKRYRV